MNYNQLTENERYQIYSLKTAGHSKFKIAKNLGRHTSTISRELRRNAGLRGCRPGQAQKFSTVGCAHDWRCGYPSSGVDADSA
uniref:helix-turn-helix domain-containing protein n=1 Tax=Microbulbifer thermotolerans TaxID=252514 RepID=UPI00396A01EC